MSALWIPNICVHVSNDIMEIWVLSKAKPFPTSPLLCVRFSPACKSSREFSSKIKKKFYYMLTWLSVFCWMYTPLTGFHCLLILISTGHFTLHDHFGGTNLFLWKEKSQNLGTKYHILVPGIKKDMKWGLQQSNSSKVTNTWKILKISINNIFWCGPLFRSTTDETKIQMHQATSICFSKIPLSSPCYYNSFYIF